MTFEYTHNWIIKCYCGNRNEALILTYTGWGEARAPMLCHYSNTISGRLSYFRLFIANIVYQWLKKILLVILGQLQTQIHRYIIINFVTQ